ncbi:hypothetical protein [Paractinoplanes durhamensis]|uniref:Esterase-like activity of phytase family protein n=1 Tax=Paractinoplanes durhamensis TaxID=113563 RepID=A0ABQ3Z002_9ACTN|nr:hypothetical protein [Actinoplanes durhamensis]GIE03162.1 hypothetical protein Adu01nite_45120 [Actinoplanes durhamensis]
MLEWEPMILRGVSVLAAVVLAVGVPGVAFGAEAAAGAQQVCKAGDKRLTELSGLAATGTGYVVVNDGSDEGSHRKIFYLDRKCKVVRTLSYPSRPRDTEDLGLATDGTLWVADIGDNGENRETIGLWRLAAGAKTPKLYRLTYPDGAHNAEALLLTRSGTPIVVTKTVGAASLYEPDGELRADRTTPLREVGTVSLPVTNTANPFGLAGRLVITGGAVSPDGKHAVLRTYADAFEFEVPGDDLAKAITDGTPTPIELPDEPQGESISYTTDGTALLTVSEESGGKPAVLQRYALPNRPAVTTPATSTAPSATSAAPARAQSSAQAAIVPTVTMAHDLPAGLLVTGGVLVLSATILGAFLLRRRG